MKVRCICKYGHRSTEALITEEIAKDYSIQQLVEVLKKEFKEAHDRTNKDCPGLEDMEIQISCLSK